MSDQTGDFVGVANRGTIVTHTATRSAEEAAAAVRHERTAWFGDVFFDHVRGVIDSHPSPMIAPNPFLLVCHWRDYNWTQGHKTTVREYADAASLIADAAKLVADERAAVPQNLELWEVYGVRTRERRPRPRAMRKEDEQSRLLDAIRAAPDDDGPRLVWADAVGGERGELVVIQCDLERGNLATRDAIARRRRQRELLSRHGRAWSGLEGIARSCAFRRGFVDAIAVSTSAFLENADSIVEAAPMLSSITAQGLDHWYDEQRREQEAIELIRRLCADVVFDQLQGLDIVGAAYKMLLDEVYTGPVPTPVGDQVIEVLIEANALRNLRALGIADSGTGSRGLRRLIGSHELHLLERLALRDYMQGDAVVAMLQGGGLQALRALDLGGSFDMVDVAPVIPRSVVELRVSGLRDDALALLAKSPIAPTLERLEVTDGWIDRDPHLFAHFPRLRSLAFAGRITGVEVLASQAMPALRELAIYERVGETALRLLVDSLGPQLELLDLRGNHHAMRHVSTLKPKIAGELLVGELRDPWPLLRVGVTPQAAWWDHVTL